MRKTEGRKTYEKGKTKVQCMPEERYKEETKETNKRDK